jgi:hypothetical protein
MAGVTWPSSSTCFREPAAGQCPAGSVRSVLATNPSAATQCPAGQCPAASLRVDLPQAHLPRHTVLRPHRVIPGELDVVGRQPPQTPTRMGSSRTSRCALGSSVSHSPAVVEGCRAARSARRAPLNPPLAPLAPPRSSPLDPPLAPPRSSPLDPPLAPLGRLALSPRDGASRRAHSHLGSCAALIPN